MKATTWGWLVLLLIPGCILVQPLDEAKPDDDGSAGSGNAASKAGSGNNNSGGAPSKAGSGGTPGTPGAGAPGSGGATGSNCVQGTLKNPTAAEKVIAASCFGIAVGGGEFTCSYDATFDETDCTGSSNSFYISFSDTGGVTVGDIYATSSDAHLGQVIQNADGDYEFELVNGSTATCVVNGSIATVCAHDGGA